MKGKGQEGEITGLWKDEVCGEKQMKTIIATPQMEFQGQTSELVDR